MAREKDDRPQLQPKHLYTREELSAHTSTDADFLTQGHRQGNGVRIHGIYFVAVSLAALVLLIVFIAVASPG